MIDALMEFASYDEAFPHLARLDDRQTKVDAARLARAQVIAAVQHHRSLLAEREQVHSRLAADRESDASRRAHEAALAKLHAQFLAMYASSDPHGRGKQLESLLNQLFDLWDLTPRAAYNIEHEQIDGAFTFRTDDYLLEARWWKEPLQPKELNDFRVKVDGKARNTLGLCVAVNGFTEGAVEKQSQSHSPLILMDGIDLMPILDGQIGLDEVLERKRRHAAETGRVLFRPFS